MIEFRDLRRQLAALRAEIDATPLEAGPVWTARPYQQDLLDYLRGGGKRAVAVWHRRAGKDLTCLHWMAEAAQARIGLYWHMLPVHTQAKKAIWNGFLPDGRRIIDMVFPPSLVTRKNDTEMLLELTNGSIVQLVGSDNFDRLVGSNPIGVTFSEFALAKPQAWQYIRPILAENGGWACFISTPRGRNALYDLFQVAGTAPGWFRQQLGIHDTGALPISTLDEERAAGMPDALIKSEYLVDFNAAQIGSVYGDLLEALANRGGIGAFAVNRDAATFTTWDLGLADATAIWWWQVDGDRVEVVDYYESAGKPLSHYIETVEKRGFKYARHFLPHDSRVRSFQTGVSTVELVRDQLGPAVQVIPVMPVAQGIEAARWLLQRDVGIHETNCRDGLEALRAYSYEFDEERRVFSMKPLHDWSSHGADSWRYLATMARATMDIERPAEDEDEKPSRVTLNLCWEDKERELRLRG